MFEAGVELRRYSHPHNRERPLREGACRNVPVRSHRGVLMQVLVRDNNIDQALRVLKKKMQREGVFREMKQRRAYEKPSERKTRERSEAIRRARKLARKQAIRDGLLPAPPKKKLPERKPPLPQVTVT
ncbi:small subunit ribosomal protein S21 [Bradyrhizobium elkanii]|nr:small subunit ribosomal protein S21 [Bradyrhizobium elkanii]MCS4105391.1 small subunit ribosomal protein S21 [Bradyrhizobium elkanii]